MPRAVLAPGVEHAGPCGAGVASPRHGASGTSAGASVTSLSVQLTQLCGTSYLCGRRSF